MRRQLLLVLCSLALFGSMIAEAAAGTVEGAVLPLSAAQEVEVCVAENPPGERCAIPTADGSYVFAGLEGAMKIEFVPTYRSRMLTQFYNHKGSFAEAELITVPHEGSVRGIDADLAEGGVVTGTVTAASMGDPLPEVEACAVSAVTPSLKSCDQTGLDGRYELHSLPTGYYRVGFHGQGSSGGYAPWYYDGGSALAQATPTLVTAGATTTIEPALTRGARVSGEVVAAAGGGAVEGISVCLFVSGASAADRCTKSGPEGAYSFEELPEGTYQVGFALGLVAIGGGGGGIDTDDYLPQFYDRVSTRAEAKTLSLSGTGALVGIDAALVASTVPSPSPGPSPVSAPLTATAPILTEPPKAAKTKRCKPGFHRRKSKGAVRCQKTKHKKGSKGHKPKHKKKPGKSRVAMVIE
jgi:hypothetical protein